MCKETVYHKPQLKFPFSFFIAISNVIKCSLYSCRVQHERQSQETLVKKQREINVSETLIPFENRKKKV